MLHFIRSVSLGFCVSLLFAAAWFPVSAQDDDFQHEFADGPTPWTHDQFDDASDKFTFAIVSDLWGGYRDGIFEVAVAQLNLLRPEFVMSVGDLIDGGTEDRAVLKEEWDQFTDMAGQIDAPFFHTGGNHDLTNLTMREVWEERYGRRYYHFRYKDVLFLVIDSEDYQGERFMELYHDRAEAIEVMDRDGFEAAKDMAYMTAKDRNTGAIGPVQSAYFERVIAENADVRWTFLFLHKKTWLADDGLNLSRIETALSGRSYSLFNGHFHSFQTDDRNGAKYTTLATTGGSQRAADNVFDQITLVTMSPYGPSVVHLRMDGILGEDGQIPLAPPDMCFQALRCGPPE